ncbi:hypothetical protein PENSPDRAFT_191346 [Peniophora sp. CONT]|nr:hypothetical protein PENSPDRAFT_191346 [Peniophora sp. CONT]
MQPSKLVHPTSEIDDWFDELEYYFYRYHIVDDARKCRAAARFSGLDVKRLIKVLRGYQQSNWEQLKSEIATHYGEDDDEEKDEDPWPDYQVYHLKRFVDETQHRPIRSLHAWREYTSQFTRIAEALLERRDITMSDMRRFFWRGMHPEFKREVRFHRAQGNVAHFDNKVPRGIRKICGAAEHVVHAHEANGDWNTDSQRDG